MVMFSLRVLSTVTHKRRVMLQFGAYFDETEMSLMPDCFEDTHQVHFNNCLLALQEDKDWTLLLGF